MGKAMGRLADRLLGVLVPKTTAAACPCNDYWTANCYCYNHRRYVKQCRSNCDCSVTTCGSCYWNYTYC